MDTIYFYDDSRVIFLLFGDFSILRIAEEHEEENEKKRVKMGAEATSNRKHSFNS
jgi:hypothetical protein